MSTEIALEKTHFAAMAFDVVVCMCGLGLSDFGPLLPLSKSGRLILSSASAIVSRESELLQFKDDAIIQTGFFVIIFGRAMINSHDFLLFQV